MIITAKIIAESINGQIIGDENTIIKGFSNIENTTSGTISFVSAKKYTKYLKNAKSSVIIVGEEFFPKNEDDLNKDITYILVPDAHNTFIELMRLYSKMTQPKVEYQIS